MQNTSAKVLKKLILFYNRPEWVLTNSMYMFGGCSRDMCELTDNRDLIQQADAVVVHVCLISDPHPASRPVPPDRCGWPLAWSRHITIAVSMIPPPGEACLTGQ